MTRARIGMWSGSLFLLAAGVAAYSRAQPPADGGGRPPSLAKRAALQAEVDLLRVEYEAERHVLSGALERTAELDLIRHDHLLSDIGLAEQYMEAISGRKGTAESVARAAEMVANRGQKDDIPELEKAARADILRLEDAWRAALGRKRGSFLKLATALNEKKLELAEAERQFNESR